MKLTYEMVALPSGNLAVTYNFNKTTTVARVLLKCGGTMYATFVGNEADADAPHITLLGRSLHSLKSALKDFPFGTLEFENDEERTLNFNWGIASMITSYETGGEMSESELSNLRTVYRSPYFVLDAQTREMIETATIAATSQSSVKSWGVRITDTQVQSATAHAMYVGERSNAVKLLDGNSIVIPPDALQIVRAMGDIRVVQMGDRYALTDLKYTIMLPTSDFPDIDVVLKPLADCAPISVPLNRDVLKELIRNGCKDRHNCVLIAGRGGVLTMTAFAYTRQYKTSIAQDFTIKFDPSVIRPLSSKISSVAYLNGKVHRFRISAKEQLYLAGMRE